MAEINCVDDFIGAVARGERVVSSLHPLEIKIHNDAWDLGRAEAVREMTSRISELEAENKKYREALDTVATGKLRLRPYTYSDLKEIARKALEAKP